MPKRVTTVKRHVTPYGTAEQRKVITIPDEVALTPEQLEQAQKEEAEKQFAAGARTLAEKRERARLHEAAHADTEQTDDVHLGKAEKAVRETAAGAVPDPHTGELIGGPVLPVNIEFDDAHSKPSAKKRGRKKKV